MLLLLGAADQRDSQHETLTHGGRLRLQGAAFGLMTSGSSRNFQESHETCCIQEDHREENYETKAIPSSSPFCENSGNNCC